MYKKLGIVLTNFVVAFWSWIVIKNWILGEAILWPVSEWIYGLIMIIVMCSVSGVSLLLLYKEDIEMRWSIMWILAFTYLIVFGFSLLNLLAIVGIVLISIWAIKISEIEIRDRTKLRVGLALRRALPGIVIPVLIAVSFAYYQNPSLQIRIENREVPVTVRTIANKVIETFLDEDSTRNLAGTDPIEEQFVDKVFSFTVNRFNSLADAYGKWLPPALAFALFFALMGISFVIVYPAVGLGWVLVWILRRVGFIRIEEYEVVAQKLIL